MEAPFNVLKKLNRTPNKKLGQNFLIHENTAKKIIAFANLKGDENILEVGPGLGALTSVLIQSHAVIAIEKDAELAEFLRTQHKDHPKLHVLEQDFLHVKFHELIDVLLPPYVVISNLPYSVSTPVIEILLQNIGCLSSIQLLLQKEVVDRICAEPDTKAYGRLTLGIQLRCEVQKGPVFGPSQFFPKPQVDSALLRLIPHPKPLMDPDHYEPFLTLISMLFQHRRKTLGKIFKQESFACPKDSVLDLSKRPGEISLAQYIAFYETNLSTP